MVILRVDQLDPLFEEKYKDYKTLERTVIPAYRRKGSEFSLLVRSYQWVERTAIHGIRGLFTYTEFVYTPHYKNTVELYFNNVLLQNFKNTKIFEEDEDSIKLSQVTINSVVPVMPNNLNDPKEFYVFFDMNGSCVLVKIEYSEGKKKMRCNNVDCLLMEKHRRP